MLFKGYMGRHLARVMRHGLTHSRAEVFDPHFGLQELHAEMLRMLQLLAPFMLLALVAALAAPMLLGGWSFSTKAMAFKPEKLNPIAGLKKLFALRGAVEVAKALGKFLIVGFVAWRTLMHFMPQFLHLGVEPLNAAMAHGAHLVVVSFFLLGGGLVAIALVDAPFQLWDHTRQLKMTRQEVRDESKETEGRPEVKGRIRNLQQQAARQRMMTEVPNADVVVTNPTHYAVALRYDEATMNAPQVVAKGADHMAAQIRSIANRHDVPLVAAPPLARALYSSTETGREVPARLYVAVARVLTYIYQLRGAIENGEAPPEPPNPEVEA
jgi:flagellar biosynthetic protein FlhB